MPNTTKGKSEMKKNTKTSEKQKQRMIPKKMMNKCDATTRLMSIGVILSGYIGAISYFIGSYFMNESDFPHHVQF